MSHITLIRHGQANSAARDEQSYDKLSPLGHEQATWLGGHMRAHSQQHQRLYTGTLRRHIETAAGMATGLEPVRDARLNELEYFTLAQALHDEHGVPIPTERESFVAHLPMVFSAWQDGKLEGAPETFEAFEDRVQSAIQEIGSGEGPALVVTSGGLISMVMRQSMRLDIPAMAAMALAIYHTSQHRLFAIGGHWSPVLFNAIPHLETSDRLHAQTHI